jgi:hypothetical protein
MTWKHVALIAIAAAVVMACEVSTTCQGSLDKVVGFALAIAGIAGGNAMQSRAETPKDKAP